jgi:serine/threonine protein kinase
MNEDTIDQFIPSSPSDPEDALDHLIACYHQSTGTPQPEVPQWLTLLAKQPHLIQPFIDYLQASQLVVQSLQTSSLQKAPEPAFESILTFGDYRIVSEIASGAMGVVYRATSIESSREVALKMIRSGRFAGAEEIRQFRIEMESAAELDHPNIVPIYHIGVHEGQPFYTMKLIEGHNLLHHVPLLHNQFHSIAAIMQVVARAVDHAHQRGVLHRDLKPANILIDQSGQPFVTDFGLARRLSVSATGEAACMLETGEMAGTPSYMAPEQAQGQRGLTTAVDVYGLGAILYHLLTGRPPFGGQSVYETLDQVIHQLPASPRQLNPQCPRELETICLTAMAKEPAQRYPSAAALADDLQRYLTDQPIMACKPGPWRHVWSWCRRHPALFSTYLIAAACFIVALLLGTALSHQRGQRLLVERSRANAFAARHVASTILNRLEAPAEALSAIAHDPLLIKTLQTQPLDQPLLQRLVERKLAYLDRQSGAAFTSIYILSPQHLLLAAIPFNDAVIGQPHAGRNYVHGAWALQGLTGRHAVYLSRVYRSTNDQLPKAVLSTLIADLSDPQSEPLGVVAASFPTAAHLFEMDLNDQQRFVVLLAPADTNPREHGPWLAPTDQRVVLLHPAYQRGDEPVAFPSGYLPPHEPRPGVSPLLPPGDDQPLLTLTDYRDPVASRDPRYAGRWLASFAPVGRTGYYVVVQERPEADPIFGLIVLGAGATILLGATLLYTGLRWTTGRA